MSFMNFISMQRTIEQKLRQLTRNVRKSAAGGPRNYYAISLTEMVAAFVGDLTGARVIEQPNKEALRKFTNVIFAIRPCVFGGGAKQEAKARAAERFHNDVAFALKRGPVKLKSGISISPQWHLLRERS